MDLLLENKSDGSYSGWMRLDILQDEGNRVSSHRYVSLKRLELLELFYFSYVYKRLCLFDYALGKKKDAICQKNGNGRNMSLEVIAVIVFVQSILINVRSMIYYYYFR